MEEFFTVVLIIIGLIVQFVVSSNKESNKKKGKLKAGVGNSNKKQPVDIFLESENEMVRQLFEDKIPQKKTVKKRKSKILKKENAPKVEFKSSIDRSKKSLQKLEVYKINDEEENLIDLREAVIYSEILKRPYE